MGLLKDQSIEDLRWEEYVWQRLALFLVVSIASCCLIDIRALIEAPAAIGPVVRWLQARHELKKALPELPIACLLK